VLSSRDSVRMNPYAMPFDQMQDLSKLKALLCQRSVQLGEFTLASGEKSNVYVDAKLTSLLAEAMPIIGRVFLHKMRECGWFPSAVGGLTVGADPIAFAIARESIQDGPIRAFIVRKEPKKHGMGRFIEGLEEKDARGLPVVIIDDVCTKGGSTAQAVDKATQAGMHVLGAVCLVDREQGAAELLKEKFGLALASIFILSELVAHKNESKASTQPVEAAV
jgi:orotate phosphoribosyltransferase